MRSKAIWTLTNYACVDIRDVGYFEFAASNGRKVAGIESYTRDLHIVSYSARCSVGFKV